MNWFHVPIKYAFEPLVNRWNVQLSREIAGLKAFAAQKSITA